MAKHMGTTVIKHRESHAFKRHTVLEKVKIRAFGFCGSQHRRHKPAEAQPCWRFVQYQLSLDVHHTSLPWHILPNNPNMRLLIPPTFSH
jgi:hypothetical protein